ncbi:hypothetical protein [Photobacterium kagoshimensis]|uniref:hypothetical protein n=1 Tax=Photobacterium kagoshimensis TaxID=2910242 RepID=UPI003D0EF0FD
MYTNLTKFFFWGILIANMVMGYFSAAPKEIYITESYFPLVEAFQFPILVFTLIALFSLGYRHSIFSYKVNKLIGLLYVSSAVYNLIMPVIVYWKQTSNISVDVIIFFFTDFWVFWLLWSSKKCQH